MFWSWVVSQYFHRGRGYFLPKAISDFQKITGCYLESVVLQGQKQEELFTWRFCPVTIARCRQNYHFSMWWNFWQLHFTGLYSNSLSLAVKKTKQHCTTFIIATRMEGKNFTVFACYEYTHTPGSSRNF